MSSSQAHTSQNSDLHIYPPRAAVQLHGPQESITGYPFLSPDSLHSFCGTCGSFVFINIADQRTDIQPLNVRVVEGVELDELKYRTYDGRAALPPYKGGRHVKEMS